jgi:hypothetical protein
MIAQNVNQLERHTCRSSHIQCTGMATVVDGCGYGAQRIYKSIFFKALQLFLNIGVYSYWARIFKPRHSLEQP